MATNKQKAKPPINTPRWALPGSPEDLDTAEQMAHDIHAERPDLLPSVARIMNAGLATEQTLTALGLFQHALTHPGDTHRDPKVAIAQASTHQTTTPHPRPVNSATTHLQTQPRVTRASPSAGCRRWARCVVRGPPRHP